MKTQPKRRALVQVLTLALFAAATVSAPLTADGQTFKVLYSFTGGADGGEPLAGLVLDPAGNVYGTTYGGGAPGCFAGCGAIFELSAGGWSESTLHTFTGGSDGGNPFDSLILDASGNLYGTAQVGGISCEAFGCGVAFELRSGSWGETVLFDFPGGTGGYYPIAALTLDKHGNLYSTLDDGGIYYGGSVYELTEGTGGWSQEILYSTGDGPSAPVILDAVGNLYSTAPFGGQKDYGVVFELLHGTWKEKTLHEFTGLSGRRPLGGLVFDKAGNLYGMTDNGGKYDMGTVFKLARSKGGKWKETVLHSFKGGSDGDLSGYSIPVFDKAGNLYGTTGAGGGSGCGGHGCGTVFKLTPGKDGRWKETVLHRFAGGSEGAGPFAGVIIDATGNLYGTTYEGGNAGCGGYGCGVVFEVTP